MLFLTWNISFGSDSFEACQNIKKNCSNQVIHIIHEFVLYKKILWKIDPLMHNIPKWLDTLQMLQDFKSVSDHFGTLCIKGLKPGWFVALRAFSIKIAWFRFYQLDLSITLFHWRFKMDPSITSLNNSFYLFIYLFIFLSNLSTIYILTNRTIK